MEIKALPANVQAEQSLLGAIIKDPEILPEVEGLINSQDFYYGRHSLIFSTVKYLEKSGIAIDVVTIAERLKAMDKLEAIGGITYLMELQDSVINTRNTDDYCKIIKEKAERRILIKTARHMLEMAYDDSIPVDEVINSVEQSFINISGMKGDIDFKSSEQVVNEAIKEIEKNYNNSGGLLGISTGIKSIDKFTSGLQKGDFIVIAARPSMGKTAFALNIAQNVSKKHKVAVFSLEMTSTQIMHRMFSNAAGIELGNVRTGSLSDKEWTRLGHISGEMAGANLYINDNCSISISDIKAMLKRLKIKKGIDVVIIDYLQLIETDNKSNNRVQEISNISRTLKVIAKELDMTVIALSQLSRNVEARGADKRPMMSDLRESGSIEQDADVVMLLYRDEYYNKESEEKNISEIIFAKNRNGSVGTAKLAWFGQYQRFGEVWPY